MGIKKLLWIMVLLVVVVMALSDTQAPTWSNPTVNNTYPRLNDSVNFQANFQDNISIDGYIFQSNLSRVLINDSFVSVPDAYCYQEFANTSNSCINPANGSYSSYGNFGGGGEDIYWKDGDYTTYSRRAACGSGGSGIFQNPKISMFANYSKPLTPSLTSVTWQVVSSVYFTNFSIPFSCFNQSIIQVGIISEANFNVGGCTTNLTLYCHNGSDFIIINDSVDDLVVEEAMFWNIGANFSTISAIKNLTNTSNINSFTWRIFTNDTSGLWNQTDFQNVTIQKIIPNVTVFIQNKPLGGNDDLNATITFEDVEGDSYVRNETRWFNNTVELVGLRNKTSISAANTSNGDNWTLSARVMDTFNWSDWKNDTVLIGDFNPPTINSVSISSLSVTTNDVITFNVNVTDNQSGFNPSACVIGLTQNNLAIPNFNITTTSISDNIVSRSLGGLTQGTLQWHSVWCDDASGNRASNISIGATIVITAAPILPSGGGGGGGGVPLECQVDLFAPREGGTISVIGRTGTIQSSARFLVRNIGKNPGSVQFEVKDDTYLRDNCRFDIDSTVLNPNINIENKIACKIHPSSHHARINIYGCGADKNYVLVVSENPILIFFNSLINNTDTDLFGILPFKIGALYLFLFSLIGGILIVLMFIMIFYKLVKG